ncbi:MAG: diaminopimelate epimerase [Ignavibacteria bacterium]|nr:MAG: diaminopimelate epimerase [Ignavibacteria bacterium]KAF0161749.1 MAG: diaminopimelate epimerase [Ignavibacteria bacterium]
MSGAGNDFILFDSKLNPELNFSNEKITQFCSRRTGIGADGILLIEDAAGYDFGMKYFNSDGTSGSLCANGARCSLQYAKLKGLLKSSKAKFVFNNIAYTGEIFTDGNVKFDLLPPSEIKINFKIKTAGQLVNACYANTGSPHIVIRIEDVLKNSLDLSSSYKKIEEFPVYDIGKEIRYHPDFAPEGTNVNFVQVENGKIKIRTYERGVEDETFSCGTGAVASAVLMLYNKLVNKPVEILAKSGDQLFVDFIFDGQKFTDVSLTGPAKVVFNGEITT